MAEDKKRHILIVEDNPGTQLQFKTAIEKAGYEVHVASNYQDAIDTIRKEAIDAAIIDVRLDEEDEKNADGLRILAQISKLESKPQAILATGLWGKYLGLEDYAYAVWEKGQELGTLVNKVKEALEEKEKISPDRIKQSLHMIIAEMAQKQLGLQDVCKLILDEMTTLINAEEANLSLVQDNILVVKAASRGELGKKLDVEDSISGWAVRRQTIVYVPNINADPRARKLYKQGLGENIQSELAVPLKIGVEPIGVLNFESPKANAFDESEIKLIEELASQVAIAINGARLQDQTNTVRRLSEISSEINAIIHSGEYEVARKALDRMLEFMKCNKAAIFTYDSASSNLEILASTGLSNEYILDPDLQENPVRRQVVEIRQPVLITDIDDGDNYISVRETAHREGFRAVLEIPLLIRESLIGSIAAYYENRYEFEQEEVALAKMFADHIAIAINNSQQYQELNDARQRAKLATIGELAGDIVHRMNSPLGAIKGNVGFIRLDFQEVLDRNPKLRESVDEIFNIANEAINMVRQLRENARQELLDKVDIKTAIEIAVAQTAIPNAITLVNTLDFEKKNITVKANQNLSRVFKNLITNAIDAMPTGGKLEIASALKDKFVEIYIKDTGIGIPNDYRDEIFNLLSVFSKKRADGGGHGLGLWYSRAFVEACGGELPPPESIVGEGTTFTVRLPVFEYN